MLLLPRVEDKYVPAQLAGNNFATGDHFGFGTSIQSYAIASVVGNNLAAGSGAERLPDAGRR